MNRWTIVAYVAALALVGLAVPAPAQTENNRQAEMLLQEAHHRALVDGDLERAIELCKKILTEHSGNRALVAKALVQMGRCYEKLGRAEARKAYERVVQEFADQPEPVRVAREHLEQLDAGVPESEAAAGIELQEVWSFPGLGELNVLAISRDGRYCAFTDPEAGGLAVRDLTTGKDQRPFETTPYYISNASISPDSKWVAYVGGDYEEGLDLRVVGIDGSQKRVLYPNEEKTVIGELRWSPDSQHVLTTFFDTAGERMDLDKAAVRIATVAVKDGSTRVLKALTPEEHYFPAPQFSLDGRYVSFDRMMDTASGQQDIFLIPLAGGPEIPLVESPADDVQLGWLPGGETLLFCSDRRGDWREVWMIRVVDGRPEGVPRLVKKGLPPRVNSVYHPPGGPVRTPTGGWAFYYREWGQTKDIGTAYVATLDPDTGKLLTAPKPVSQPTPGRERVVSPDFSRDGKYLAYYAAPASERSPKGPRFGPGNIVIRSLETGQERKITPSPKFSDAGFPRHLCWAPDGRSILIHGWSETGRKGIYRVDIDTGNLNPVVLHAPEQTRTDWQLRSDLGRVEGETVGWGELSPDGKTLFFGRWHLDWSDPRGRRVTRSRILARDLETGQEREIYRNPDGVFGRLSYAVSPDGQRVVIRDNTSLLILPTKGGEPRELFELEGGFDRRIATWTPDSRHLLLVKIDQERRELWRVAAEGGEPERLDALPARLGTAIGRLRVHPDGQQIAFTTTAWVRENRIRMIQILFSD